MVKVGTVRYAIIAAVYVRFTANCKGEKKETAAFRQSPVLVAIDASVHWSLASEDSIASELSSVHASIVGDLTADSAVICGLELFRAIYRIVFACLPRFTMQLLRDSAVRCTRDHHALNVSGVSHCTHTHKLHDTHVYTHRERHTETHTETYTHNTYSKQCSPILVFL